MMPRIPTERGRIAQFKQAKTVAAKRRSQTLAVKGLLKRLKEVGIKT